MQLDYHSSRALGLRHVFGDKLTSKVCPRVIDNFSTAHLVFDWTQGMQGMFQTLLDSIIWFACSPTHLAAQPFMSRMCVALQVVSQIWADICTGSAESDPSLLCRFLLLAFADLKNYQYHYWYGVIGLLPWHLAWLLVPMCHTMFQSVGIVTGELVFATWDVSFVHHKFETMVMKLVRWQFSTCCWDGHSVWFGALLDLAACFMGLVEILNRVQSTSDGYLL